MSEYSEGSKYQETKDLDITDVTKLVRKDLKEHFPDYKCTVQIERYSMGQSLHIQLNKTGIERRTATESDVKDKVRRITEQYNYHNDDFWNEYHDNKFYAHIRVES